MVQRLLKSIPKTLGFDRLGWGEGKGERQVFCLSQSDLGCLLGGVYVRCIHRMPGGVIVGDSSLCCCGPAFNVMCDVNIYYSSAITSHCLLIAQT